MKQALRYGLALVAALFFSFNLGAQDINEIIDLFNKANQEFKAKQYDQSKVSVTKVYDMLTTLGDVEGEEVTVIKGNCEKLLQAIPYMQGKDLLVAEKYNEAMGKLLEAKSVSEKFSNQEVVAELDKLIDLAKTNLVNNYLVKANEAQKTENWAEVAANAVKSLEIDGANAQALGAAGAANLKLKKYDTAITYLEKAVLLEKDNGKQQNISYQLALAYEMKGDKAKACENYKKIRGNEQFKAYAESKIKSLGCN